MNNLQKCCVQESNNSSLKCQFEIKGFSEFFWKRNGQTLYHEYNGNTYCIFHLPIESEHKDSLKHHTEIGTILRGINPMENYQYWVDYSYVRLSENQAIDIQLDKQDFKLDFSFSIINSKIHIVGNTVELDFKEATFNKICALNMSSLTLDCHKANIRQLSISGNDLVKVYLNLNKAKFVDSFVIKRNNWNQVVVANFLDGGEGPEFINNFHLHNLSIDASQSESIIFHNTIFNNIDITNCKLDNVSFVNCKLGKHDDNQSKVNFEDTLFKNVYFKNCKFMTDTHFILPNFDSEKSVTFLSFIDKTFFSRNLLITCIKRVTGKISFNEVAFRGEKLSLKDPLENDPSLPNFKLGMTGCTVDSEMELNFEGINYCDFSRTKFNRTVSFERVRFAKGFNFKDCVFRQAPNFYLAILHPDIIFPGINAFRDQKSEVALNRYHDLYVQCAELKHRQYEGQFYVLSKRCETRIKNMVWQGWKGLIPFSGRRMYHNLAKWVLSKLYDAFSYYGTNYIRPFLMILGLTIAFPFVYRGIGHGTIHDVISYCLQQLLKPFSVWSESGNQFLYSLAGFDQGLIFKLRAIGTVQSVLTLILLTLFFIALRWNYRKE